MELLQVMAAQSLLYVSVWTGEQWESRIETAGVQLLWAISDHKPNGETREGLRIFSLDVAIVDVATVDAATVDHTNRRTKR